MTKTWRVCGINFEHGHMHHLLELAHEHPQVEVVGVCHEDIETMQPSIDRLALSQDKVYTDYRRCLEETKPDIVMLCPATGGHAQWTLRVAPYNVHVFMEKPFAASVADARQMIAALQEMGKGLIINWPLRWYPPHVTSKRLIDEGVIGEITGVHYYDGNRGPVHPRDDSEPTPEMKSKSWFYKRDAAGGSLADYLGYGVTLASWFNGGQEPLEVTCVQDIPPGLEVDEHSVTVVRYKHGLSKFETRWGTFTDPWVQQPQPKCGFVITGERGTISSYDYEPSIRVQTREHPEGRVMPVDTLEAPFQNPLQYFIHCLETNTKVEGPLSPELSLLGQRIIDAAQESARLKRTVSFAELEL
jgi:predicted dehydrogenase